MQSARHANLKMSRDPITGLSLSSQSASALAGQNLSRINRDLVPVYLMVADVANGLTASDGRCITPGGAHPQVPGLTPNTEVYQLVAEISHGIGYGPGNALVPIPSQATLF